MYIPPAFNESDPEKIFAFIRENSFGTLVTTLDGALTGSHIPFLVEPQNGPQGALVGHLARANPQSRSLVNKGGAGLAIFTGPHAYISPTWYQNDKAVPTWNYTSVHATGTFEPVEDEAGLRAILQATVAVYEASQPQPWSMQAASDEFISGLLKHIIGFRLIITKLEGKWKLNQNRAAEEQSRVVSELMKSRDVNARALGELMRKNLEAARK